MIPKVPKNAEPNAAVLGTGIQHQLKPGGPKGIVGSTPTGGTRRLVVHCKKEPYDVYIGRPSQWGNPFSHLASSAASFRVATVEEAIACYEEWLKLQPDLLAEARRSLRGKVLGCWCHPKACHGDVLVRIANG